METGPSQHPIRASRERHPSPQVPAASRVRTFLTSASTSRGSPTSSGTDAVDMYPGIPQVISTGIGGVTVASAMNTTVDLDHSDPTLAKNQVINFGDTPVWQL